ncbi:Glutathione gamma-glutamylcysteinyltransferase 1 [Forsythia ovata]|uniref:Glutathione gamma-glutamylcysteinyltransferase 1 n=1 Tax=Forsythia ovata TaxID=205694 RepID=A0ABD1T6T8_9LAMI
MDTVLDATGLRRGFMLVSRHQTAPSLLYSLSCKHESWVRTAMYLMDDVPLLLSSNNMKDVKHVISTVFTSLPSDFAEFIKWVAEFRRQEDGGRSVSQEEKGRLSIKDDVLKQVEETGLYKLVMDIISSEQNVCQNKMTIGNQDGLPNIAASVCCQGAGFLAGKSGSLDRVCSRETGVRCYKANGDKPVRVDSGNVINCCSAGSCSYSGMHPASDDVLTALLLALPPRTWTGIKDNDVLQEISSLVSLEGLPPLLKEENTFDQKLIRMV